jgi:hypothetical protein
MVDSNNFVDMINYKCTILYIIWYKVLFTVFRANIKIIFGGLVFTVTPRSAKIIISWKQKKNMNMIFAANKNPTKNMIYIANKK